MEKNQFVDLAILDEILVSGMKHIGINRNQVLVEILDRNSAKGGFSLAL
ncbi:MAG: hypothetical protein M3297_03860 [Thermoproteota archaeon]|jgi:hypothetical protein|nr:hypothetical protein [Thermoproteota archaeon]